MLRKLSISLFISTVIFSGCQKEVDKQTAATATLNNANTIRNGMVGSTGMWFGTFNIVSDDPDGLPDTISEALLIHDGEASFNKSIYGEYLSTSIGYYMPADKKIAGGSTTFTVMVMDKAGIVQLDITGKRNIAHAACVKNNGDSSTITLSVGKSIITSVAKPAIDFSAFREVSLIIKEKKAVLLIGNISRTVLLFTNADKIGNIKLLSTGYDSKAPIGSSVNGALACTAVRLFNSYSHKPVMKETFSTNGKSNTIFY